jgi:hypothetical protein
MSALRAVIVLACTLLIACAAIVAVDRLQAEATAGRDAELELINLRLQLAQIQDVPWGASPEEGDDVDDVRGELLWMQEEIEGSLDRLSRDGDLPEREQIIAPFERGVGALEEILELVATGRGDETGDASSLAAHEIAEQVRTGRRSWASTSTERAGRSSYVSPACLRCP